VPARRARLGVLDFQDAVYGPITYDIASLMRDAFLSSGRRLCAGRHRALLGAGAPGAGLPVDDDFGEFYRGVEWMGLQRHLKVAGIFARLTLRDGKPQYLADTPRFIGYIRATCSRYRELKPLLRLVDHGRRHDGRQWLRLWPGMSHDERLRRQATSGKHCLLFLNSTTGHAPFLPGACSPIRRLPCRRSVARHVQVSAAAAGPGADAVQRRGRRVRIHRGADGPQ